MGACYSSKAGKKGKGRNTKYTTVQAPYANRKQGYTVMSTPNAKQENEIKAAVGYKQRNGPYSRGQSTLFGFKRRPSSAAPSVNSNLTSVTNNSPQPLDNTPLPRRACSQDSLNSISPSTSPRLSRPTAVAAVQARPVRVNRFGFKSPVSAGTTNKVADSNANVMVSAQQTQELKNLINKEKPRSKGGGKIVKPIKAGSPGTPMKHTPTLELGQTARFTLQTSLLPAPQFPIRLASVDTERRSKGAKTMANNSAKNVRNMHGSGEDSSSNGSLNADSGIGSQRSAEVEPCYQEIETLEASPGMSNRRNQRQVAMRKRELEVVVTGKSFDVRDLKEAVDDPNVITEISVISLPKMSRVNCKPAMKVSPQIQPGARIPQPNTGVVRERKLMYQQRQQVLPQEVTPSRCVVNANANAPKTRNNSTARWSGEWRDEGLGEEEDEEKVLLDRCDKEKNLIVEGDYGNWGQGEAMAEELTTSEDAYQTRPIHLEIEEARFAAIAAGESSLIEDERSPVDSLMSNSLPTSSDNSEVDNDNDKDVIEGKEGPESPGTPTNASNSLSLSEGRERDFLIDDEIADQPGLMFDEQVEMSDLVSSIGVLEVTESTPTLVETFKAAVQEDPTTGVTNTPKKARSRAGSVDTLSPCESITSDDLMMDFDRSEGSAFNASRVGSCAGLQNMDEASILSELGSQNEEVFREWSNLLGAHSEDAGGLLSGRSTRFGLRSRPNSTPDSPRSIDSKPSPLRPPRQPSGSESDDGTSFMRIDRSTYQQMCQDIVSMKTMLLKLKRLFQENEENSLTMAETLNPFDSSLKNGLFYSLAGSEASNDLDSRSDEVSAQEEVVDLRRQVVFLQQQVDERERTVQLLQLQMTRYTTGANAVVVAPGGKESINAATQTERIRPVSAGPSLLQSLPADGNLGPLVSLNDGWRQRKSSLNARKLSSPSPQRRVNATGIPTRLQSLSLNKS